MERFHGSTDEPISSDLTSAAQTFRELLEPCGDMVFRPLELDGTPPMRGLLMYCRNMVDAPMIDEQALRGLLLQLNQGIAAEPGTPGRPDLAWLSERRDLPLGAPSPAMTVSECCDAILSGAVALLVDGCTGAMLFAVPKQVGRPVAEPMVEGVIRGPREGFTENVETNLALVRRRLRTTAFRMERYWVGARTHTELILLYVEGVTDSRVVRQARRRLRAIRTDSLLDSGRLEELIEDAPFSPFPTINHTERPDKVAAYLLEGHVSILTAGSPQALLFPTTLVQFLHSPEDYFERYLVGTAVRALRFLAAFLSVTLPSLYVAVTTYHHEMIPSDLFQALAAQREGVPWPAVVEAYLMEIAFELLREAGVRLPRPVGQAISIIGGLVIGEAAIRARIASAGMVIVVAATGIASYAVPAYDLSFSLRLIRFPLMLLAATLGLHGVMVGLLLLLIHLLNLRSFGVPYLSPITPAKPGDWKDMILRAPWWHMTTRPDTFRSPNRQRGPGRKRAPGGEG